MAQRPAALPVAAGLAVLCLSLQCLVAGASAACVYQDCESYCSGACPFRPNISHSGVDNLAVYRITPWNVTDMGNHDTGDAAGDMGFLLEKYMRNSQCMPPYNTEECFLDDRPIVAQFPVSFAATYGPYLHCNPSLIPGSDKFVDTSNFYCAYKPPEEPNPWSPNGATGCAPPCDRVNVTVGRDPAHHLWPGTPAARRQVSSYFGGYWYSTPSRSQCVGDRAPGDGKSPLCTWKVVGKPKYVNASCLAGILFDVLEKANPSCFSACGPGAGRGNPCFGDCVTKTVLGPSGGSGIDIPPMVAAWESAFNGKCPLLPVPGVSPPAWPSATIVTTD